MQRLESGRNKCLNETNIGSGLKVIPSNGSEQDLCSVSLKGWVPDDMHRQSALCHKAWKGNGGHILPEGKISFPGKSPAN